MSGSELTSDKALAYRPEVDGLRALAVLIVTLYHFDVVGFSGGYIGVDIFFVISGYLITSIIVDELHQGTFTLRSFYARRIRRILPALLAVTLCSIPFAMVILVPRDLEDFGQSVISVGFFFQNFLFYSESGYFGGPAELKPLLHTWSLAVEEQFYLLFPLLCLLLAKFKVQYWWVFSLLLFASLGFAEWFVRVDANGAFYLLPSRWWELMLGSLIALLPRQSIPLKTILSLIGIALILFALVQFDQATRFPGLRALLPCIGTGLLIVSLRSGNGLMPLFTLKPLVALGLISYSLYLWHFPIAAFARRLLGRDFVVVEQIVLIGLSVALAVLSWRFIEQPFRGSKSSVSTVQVKWFVSICMVGVISFGLFTDLADGAWWRFGPETQSIIKAHDVRDRGCIGKDDCTVGEGETLYAIWGDSHADAALSPFAELSSEQGVATEAMVHGGCLPLVGFWPGTDGFAQNYRRYNEKAMQRIETGRHHTVFLHGRWNLAIQPDKFKYEGGLVRPTLLYPEHDESLTPANTLEIALDRTVGELKALGKRVVIVGPVPEAG